MMNRLTFPERLRAAMGRKSSAQVARDCGMKPQQYERYVRGETEPKIGNLVRICKALDCSANELLGIGDRYLDIAAIALGALHTSDATESTPMRYAVTQVKWGRWSDEKREQYREHVRRIVL